MLQDIRYAARKLARTPGFTVIAAFTLALAIGATTAIFSVIDGVLLKPLPFPDPDKVVRVTNMRSGSRMVSSAPDFVDFRAQAKSFSDLTGFDNQAMNLTGGSEPERVSATRVSANFWTMLGVNPALGRGFAEGEDKTSAGRVVVLSDGLWKRRFGADERIGLGGYCRVRRDARTEVAESRGSDESTVRNVAEKEESPDAVLEDPVHDEHRIAGAPLGVLDRTPWGRNDVTFNCGQARARRVHVASITA